MRHFAATEAQRDLGLVAVFQELDEVAQLDAVVAFIGAGAELDFLDLDDLLLQLGFVGLLLLGVLELALVHQAADRWDRVWRDLDQVDVLFLGHAERFRQAHDAQWFVVHTVQAHFWMGDLAVDAILFVSSYFVSFESMNFDRRFIRRVGYFSYFAFVAISPTRRSNSASTGITPRSTLPRARTATVFASRSLSPTTRMYGSFWTECSRIL